MEPKPLKYRRFWLGLGWAIGTAILFLSLYPFGPTPNKLPGIDKIFHLLAYAGLTAWFVYLFPGKKALLIIVVCVSFLGLSVEMLQTLFPQRIGDLYDAAANEAGIILGALSGFTPLKYSFQTIERVLFSS